MIISFSEFISLKENIERYENENELELLERMLRRLDHEDLVQFAYNTANSVSYLMANAGKQALELVKKWLQDKDISPQQLLRSSDEVSIYSNRRNLKMKTSAATASAAYTANVAYQISNTLTSFSSTALYDAAASAKYVADTAATAEAYAKNDLFFDEKLYTKRMVEFAQLANSLVFDKKHGPAPSNKWFNKNIKDFVTLAVWFDSLEEGGNQEILDQIKSLAQNTEGYNAKSNQDLARIIMASPHKGHYLYYIQNMFKGVQ